jgi:hypothetical protein
MMELVAGIGEAAEASPWQGGPGMFPSRGGVEVGDLQVGPRAGGVRGHRHQGRDVIKPSTRNVLHKSVSFCYQYLLTFVHQIC